MTEMDPFVPQTGGKMEPVIMRFYLSKRYQDSISSTRTIFSLTEEDVVLISELDRAVMMHEMDLEAYLLAVEEELKSKLSEEQRDALYAKLLAERFVPLGDFLKPSAGETAAAEELTLPVVPYYRVYFKPLSYAAAADEVAAMAGLSLADGALRGRLRELLISKMRGVRIDAQVREVLLRGSEVGGFGAEPKIADAAVWAMNDLLDRVKLISEDEESSRLAREVQANKPPLSAEDQEIATIQARTLRLSSPSSSNHLDESIQVTLDRLTYQPQDAYAAKRLRNVISSRLRDVRSALEVRQLLQRDIKVGGLGLEAGTAEQVGSAIETAYQEFHGQIETEERMKIEHQIQDQKHKIEERHKREAEDHARWFEDKIRSRKVKEAERTQMVSEWQRKIVGPTSSVASSTPVHPLDAKEKRREQDKFGVLVEGASEGVRISRATVDLVQAQSDQRPSLDALAAVPPQLMGLVGELRAMSLAEFRRMAKEPEEARKKVLQKIDTLAQESFEKKMEGMRAFKESPLQAAYMNLVAESFRAAKPVHRLAEEKRAKGEDTLSPAEIAAMIALNSALHF